MKSIFVNLVIFALLCNFSVHSAKAFDGGITGGGHGIVCFESESDAERVKSSLGYVPDQLLEKIISIDFLDYYYAKIPVDLEPTRPVLIDEAPFNNGLELYFFIKNRLQGLVPELYAVLDQSENIFTKTGISWAPIAARPLREIGLPDVITDLRCTMVLMAFQQRINFADYLQIDHRIYNHAINSKLSQASVYLHEFLYLDARNKGDINSSAVIMLVRLLLQKELRVDKLRAEAVKLGFIRGLPAL